MGEKGRVGGTSKANWGVFCILFHVASGPRLELLSFKNDYERGKHNWPSIACSSVCGLVMHWQQPNTPDLRLVMHIVENPLIW